MLKNLKKSSVTISVFCFFLTGILCSCNSFGSLNSTPDFSISKPVYKVGKVDKCCELAGVFFDFYNKSGSTVTYIEIKMNVFDKATKKNAFIGIGTISSRMNCSIGSGVTRNLCIPLDEYITVIPDSELLIDQFYISTVQFANGAVWNDFAGIYATSSE